jgi:fluoride exporter
VRSLWIGIAGFFGALARYHVEGWVSRATRSPFPWGTMVVNTTGCFLLGFLFTVLAERFLPHPTLRSALTIGFLGAYTTFSTFALETLQLGQDGAALLAVVNTAASLVAGVCAAWLGMVAGRVL